MRVKVVSALVLCLLATSVCAFAQEGQKLPETEEMVTIPKAELESIKAKLADLEGQLEEIKKGLGQTPGVEEESIQVESSQEPIVIGGSTSTGAPQTLLPDISIVGDIVGKFTTSKDEPNRNDVMLRGAELVLHGYLYPQIRGDAVICMGEEHNHEAVVEETYISFLQIGNTSLSGTMGKKRLDFGKVNKIHPHHRPYITAPAVYTNFLGEEGLVAEGISLDYLFPSRQFLSLEVGAWRLRSHRHLHDEGAIEPGPGFTDKIYSGRVWASRQLAENAELELGISGVRGTGVREIEEGLHVRDSISIVGVDATYKNWVSAFGRTLLQCEFYTHKRAGVSRAGYYGLACYKWSKYWEAGLRYDWSEMPFPADGRESGVSLVLTNHLTETTQLRFQLTHGSRAGTGSFNQAFLQAIWGIGPHSHPLE